jgi:hypothetical protein
MFVSFRPDLPRTWCTGCPDLSVVTLTGIPPLAYRGIFALFYLLEPKTAKNRVHLDVRVAGREVRGEARRRLVSEHVERLVQAGASLAWRTDNVRGSSVTLYDPEGNEFCVS